MAVQVKLDAEADKSSVYVYDETGTYNRKCNPTGWGVNNLDVSDITEATVEVFPPEAGESEGILIDVYDSLPNDKNIGFEITAEDLDLPDIKSGVWKFVYRLVGDSGSFEVAISITKYFDEVIACCVDNALVNVCGDDFTSEENKRRIEMEMLLESARNAACKGDMNTAQKIANHLTLMCKCCK